MGRKRNEFVFVRIVEGKDPWGDSIVIRQIQDVGYRLFSFVPQCCPLGGLEIAVMNLQF